VRIEWALFAMNDREATFDYLEADSPRAAILIADLIDDRIEAQVELLIETPEIGRPGRIEGTRELVNALYCSLQN
jgi:toxin ParE1/3/4